MRAISKYYKKCRITYLWVAILAVVIAAFLMPNVRFYHSVGNNIYTLMINGQPMGTVDSPEDAESIMNEARRKVAAQKNDLVLIDAESRLEGQEILRGKTDPREQVLDNVVKAYSDSIKATMKRSYTVKIDKYMVNVSSMEEVSTLLEASLNRYETTGKFSVELVPDSSRELPVYVPVIVKNVEQEEETDEVITPDYYLGQYGVFGAFEDVLENIEVQIEPDFDDFDYGITDMKFANNVEIVEAYLPSNEITPLDVAIDEVTKDKEQKTVYEVVSGDTLSGISGKVGISMDEIIALNETLEDSRTTLHIGDELIITVPKPELSVEFDSLYYYEGTYEADVIYIYNDDWYTTKEVVLQDPSSGYHKAVEKTSYLNGDIKSTEVIKEEVIVEAVPKIVEKGTKIPPTYVWPCSSWRITSYFGYRTSTMRGMTSNHQAVDIAMPTGSSVWASCGGTITHAGWMSSYGYCIFIKHPDGRETRYAHLSRVLVSKGQSVSQGQKIGLSGSTGVSTGPHLHFEMRMNGRAVNPLNYID